MVALFGYDINQGHQGALALVGQNFHQVNYHFLLASVHLCVISIAGALLLLASSIGLALLSLVEVGSGLLTLLLVFLDLCLMVQNFLGI